MGMELGDVFRCGYCSVADCAIEARYFLCLPFAKHELHLCGDSLPRVSKGSHLVATLDLHPSNQFRRDIDRSKVRVELVTRNSQPAGKLNIGILGGGVTGLTAAFYLLREGHQVTILESRSQVGGLATFFDFGPFCWDKFYHCILTSDEPLLQLIEELGLSSELRWTQTKVGFYTDKGLYSMSSTMDFLKFPPLSLWEKFRLGLGVLRTSRIRDGKKLESILVSDWLVKFFGRGNYEKMWGPLLKCKLGACREEASAAFIWATIFRLNSTRKKGSRKECLGYVRGGYRTVFARLLEQVHKMGGVVRTSMAVEGIESNRGGGLSVRTTSTSFHFDRVIATAPSHIIEKMTPELSDDYKRRLKEVKYLGMVCVVLLLKRKLSPYYTTNLTEQSVPFTGVIEMTSLISLDETAGRHLVYLPKYTAPGDPLFDASDDDVWNLFRKSFIQMFPDLDEIDIEKRFVFREKLVQPLPVLHYSDRVPPMQTNIPGLLVANTTQIINSTLNNNEMVKIARQAVNLVAQQSDAPRLADRAREFQGATAV
jgi:protoporphyrinogen oxidase